MREFDFDAPVERRGTDCEKFDFAERQGHGLDELSLWVADMDFPAPQPVLDALAARVAHGVFGYTKPGEGFYAAVCGWMARYGWQVEPEQVVTAPGVVFALSQAVLAFTEPGDAVLIQQPVYYPFANAVVRNGRRLVNAPLVLEGTRYGIDFDAFERMLVTSGAKLFILCNPHNPVGRVWTREELTRLAEICAAHGTLVVSDEIHMDFFRPGFTHTPFAALGDFAAQNAVVCTAASKSFNLAGLQCSSVVIPNPDLRKRFCHQLGCVGAWYPNALGLVATQAAYERGEAWLSALKDYLEGNWELLGARLAAEAPELTLIPAEGTYLAWIDCRRLGMPDAELQRFVQHEAKLWIDPGAMFGPGGEGFIRINLATQRAYLGAAIDRLVGAIAARR